MARFSLLGIAVGLSWLPWCGSPVQAQPPGPPPGPPPMEAPVYGEDLIGGTGYPYPPGYGTGPIPEGSIPEAPMWFSRTDPSRWRFGDPTGWFFRTEYLNWDFKRPGDTLLGAPILGISDPTTPFPVFDFSIPPAQIGSAVVPSLKPMRLDSQSGVRGTIGIPLTFGSFEASMTGFSKASETISFGPDTYLDPDVNVIFPLFTGTSTLVNGLPSQNIELYNDTFLAAFTSRLWGTETNLFLHGSSTNFFTFMPIVGFRYLDLEETLNQRGNFVDPLGLQPDVLSEIDSQSHNRLFTPQIGLRSQFDCKYFSFSFDPKYGMGLNSYNNMVRTNHFRSNADPEVITRNSAAQMAHVLDLGFTGRIHLTPNFSLTAGYNYIWLGNITRAHNNIYYNDNGDLPTPPGVVLSTKKTDMTFQGISMGAELKF